MVDMWTGAMGGGPPLATALHEAAAARGARAVEALAAGLDRLRASLDFDEVAALAVRAGAMRSAEELLAAEPPPGRAVLDLQRLVTGQQIAWPAAGDVMTSLAEVELPGPAARGLFAIVAELVAVVEADAPVGRHVRLFLASEVDGGDLVLAFAAAGVDEKPILSVSAWRSLCRAERLAALIGGDLVRGHRDGMMIVGITVALATTV